MSDSATITINLNNANDTAPVITSNGGGATAAITVAENSTAVTTVTATDADGGSTLSYSITGGADAGRFSIDSNTGVLTFMAAPDYEVPTDVGGDNVYDVVVQVSDGLNTDSQSLAVTVTAVNDTAPVITSNGGGATAAITVAENSTAVTTVTATDADGGSTLSYSITGGADAGRFSIDSNTGVLTFMAAPDYEVPTDVGGDNVYDVVVQVSDGLNTDSQSLAVTVTAVNDTAPVITSNGGGATAAITVAENSTAVTTVTATDADGGSTLSYSITGGADAGRFSIDSNTGVLTFMAAPDYEVPTDVGGDNVYDVVVQVSDGLNTDSQSLAVTVTAVVATTYTVTNTNDSGAGSLRQAILDANASSGTLDTIVFNIAGTGVHTITPLTALPTITDAVILDASTDDSFAANSNRPAIVLDGNDLAANGLTLTNTADGSTIRGFVIRDFAGNGIYINSGSDNNTIAGNYVGRLNSNGTDAGVTEAVGGTVLRWWVRTTPLAEPPRPIAT